MPRTNDTHRRRLARALRDRTDLGYREALDQVNNAAAQGLLPARLDDAGMAAALRILTNPPAASRGGWVPAGEAITMMLVMRISGPLTSKVFDSTGMRQAPPVCDWCDRRLEDGEPWWHMTAYGADWFGGTGVVCQRHEPNTYPSRLPAVSGPHGRWDLTGATVRSGPEFAAIKAPFGGWSDCVACGHVFTDGEPRFMIEKARQGWPGNAAAVCARHHPDGPVAPAAALGACAYCRSFGNNPHNDGQVCECDGYCGSLHCGWERQPLVQPKPDSARKPAGEPVRPEGFGDAPAGYCLACHTGYLSNRLDDGSEECARCGAPRRPAPRSGGKGQQSVAYDRLKTGLLVQTTHDEILKISNVFPDQVTAQVVYPIPPRTTVRYYTRAETQDWTTVADDLYDAYERAWGFKD